jgi:hypothetical protein
MAPTIDPMIPLGRSSMPSPEIRLNSSPPTNDPISPTTIATVQSMGFLPLRKIN